MIFIGNIYRIKESDFDEVWAVVRSPKNIKSKTMLRVPELSPSWNLFKMYLSLKDKGQWDKEAFEEKYMPVFQKEMEHPKAKAKLEEVIEKSNAGKNIVK